jgi:predicted cobalt transporter CbtA
VNRPTRTAPVTLEVEAEPATVIAVVADPARIPEWAPGCADAVHTEDDGAWSATKDGQRFSLRVAVDLVAGTVDILRVVAPGVEGGAQLHVTPRRGGGAWSR